MKKNLFLISLLIAFVYPSFINAKQQDYRPLLKIGKTWNCYMTNNRYEFNLSLTVVSDTMIDGDRCYRITSKMVNQLTGEIMSEGSSSLFLEKDKKVYSRGRNKDGVWIWQLLYDFNLKEGDERTLSDEQKQKVTADDQVYVMGRTFRRLKIKEALEEHGSKEEASGYWVEGIGSSHGLLRPCDWTLESLPFCMVSCYEDGKCIFTGAEFENMPSQQTNAVRSKLLREGREWWYHDYEAEFTFEAPDDFNMYVEGDTLINGLRWKKIYRKKTAPVYEKAMREQGSCVYELRPDGQESLLFDFSLKVGDSYVPVGEQGHKMTVIAVDTVMVDSVARRRLLLMQEVNGVTSDLTTWTEGVGSECGIDLPAYWSDMDWKVVNQTHGDNYYYLDFLGCKDNGTDPVDMTSMIVNPRFDNNDVTTGWSGTEFGNYNAKDNAEMYGKNYNTYQQIGGLQPGVYAVGVSAFYMPGNEATAYSHFKASDEISRYAKLYSTGVRQTEVPIVSIFDSQRTEPLGCTGEKSVIAEETGQALYIPYNLPAAERYMHELGCYRNRVLAMVDSSLVIGVKKESLINPDWSVFDDFTLTYFGNGADAYQMYLDEVRKEYDSFTIADGTLYTEAYLDDARQYLAVHGEDAVLAALEYIENAYAKLQENIALWKKWQTVIARGRSLAAIPLYEGRSEAQQLASYCTEKAAAIETEHKLTNEELAAAVSEMESMMGALYNLDEAPKMLAEGKQWVYSHHVQKANPERWEEVVTKVTFTLGGDTLIDGRLYMKLYRQEESEAPVYSMALREEEGTVYCYRRWYDNRTEEERRFIEFNPSHFEPSFMDPCKTDATERIDTITVNGRLFVRHFYNESQIGDWYLPEFIGVEGIGYEDKGILGMDFKISMSDRLHFEACYENSECIFTKDDFNRKSGETDGIDTTKNASNHSAKGAYDLQGRRVIGTPRRGIYVKDGKKYVVK